MRPFNRILSDGIVSFGKYKSERLSGAQLAKKDPGYLVWCVAANVVSVDEKVEELIAAWVADNHEDAERAILSGEKARHKRQKELGEVSGTGPAKAHAPVARPPASSQHPAWGSW